MKKLSEISIHIDLLPRLAAEAPPEEEKSPGKRTGKKKKSRPGASSKASLGPLKVEEYLNHYNIAFTPKKAKGKTLYLLSECLFDPNHKKNEAAIVQDDSGLVTYQCFHNSCQSRTWHDARALISGSESLAPFCEGYDPDLSRPRSPFDTGPGPAPPLDDHQVVPSYFFDNDRFIPQFLAKHLERVFHPLLYDGMDFYSYDPKGVWHPIEYDQLGHDCEKALDKYAKSARIIDTIKILGHRTFISPQAFRHNPGFLNLKSGMIDLASLRIHPHAPEYYSRIQLPVAMQPSTECPRWIQFLEEIFPESPEKRLTLQSFMGYCLLPDCRYQRCMFLIGSGANGKSVVVDTLVSILGEENICSLPLQLMGQRFLIGQLKDKLLNVATELATNQPMDTANFKDAVVGGLLMADQKHGRAFAFYPIAKHVFSMNEVPKITDKSYGFQRRPIVLTFNERFEGARRDPYLTKKLIAERDGIFKWMLEGLAMILQADDLYIAESVDRDTQQFVKSTNPVLLFVEDCCTLENGANVKPPDLYRAYKYWCKEGSNRPLARNRFYDQILIHFPSVFKTHTGPDRQRIRVYVNIGLLDGVPLSVE